VDPRVGLNDVEKRKFLPQPAFELRPLRRPACSQSLYRLSYPGSSFMVFLMAREPLWALAAFQSPDLFTIGRTPWTSDQLVARPLPKHRTAKTQNKHIYTPNIRALSGIQTHDHSVRASEDSSCLRPFRYSDRPFYGIVLN
jgi:hypothetical protein